MKNLNDGPGQKQDQDKNKTTEEKTNKPTSKDRSRYYKEGEETATGPNWDKMGKGADGDTSPNAGVFK